MIALIAAALSHFTCPGASFLAHGVQPDGRASCYVDTDDGVRLVARGQVTCRRGEVPVVQIEGRSIRCTRVASGGDA